MVAEQDLAVERDQQADPDPVDLEVVDPELVDLGAGGRPGSGKFNFWFLPDNKVGHQAEEGKSKGSEPPTTNLTDFVLSRPAADPILQASW